MEDKEIIIDGVDVTGCVQLVEEPNYPCGLGGECEGWENCYYKQLKRLEQENEILKEENKTNTCLQEIKKYIAKICKEECGYVQKKRCLDCDCRFGAILDLITKAEEE